MNDNIERWAKNKISSGWRQSIANTPVRDCGITIHSGMDRGESYVPSFIEQVEFAYNKLSNKEKMIIKVEYFETGNQNEKAEKLNISCQCFRDRLCRARKKINQSFLSC